MWQSRIFCKKSPSGKNGQKWPKNMVFRLFKKITSLVLSGICVKWKFLWFINILRKLHAWEKSDSHSSASEISVFFNRQYFAYRLISNFDFWHVDRLEYKKQSSGTVFLKKILILGIGPFWAQKLRILITPDPLKEFFLNFAQWKGPIGRWKWS